MYSSGVCTDRQSACEGAMPAMPKKNGSIVPRTMGSFTRDCPRTMVIIPENNGYTRPEMPILDDVI